MTEVGPVSYECPDRPGVLHVNETSYIVEVVHPQTGQPVQYGSETGELVLTTLGRVGSPVIRYRTGDLVKPGHDGLCECGRYDLTLEAGILGRVDDMVIVRGVNIYPSAVEQIVGSCAAVSEYRVRILTKDALPELEVDVEVTGADSAAVIQQLQSEFERAFRLRVPVIVVSSGLLPRSEMKSRHFVSG
jgi:phenylacetate-CoA ligase